MDQKEIATLITELYPGEVVGIAQSANQISVIVRKDRIKDILKDLRDVPSLGFDLLSDLCGVDYPDEKKPRFEVVYHLFSLTHRHMIRIKAGVPADDCSIESVVDLWAGADWFERECYDMFGIRFDGHPDLRRILMPEDWEGHPLRKDYPLKSNLGEHEWKEYLEVIDAAEKNRRFNVT